MVKFYALLEHLPAVEEALEDGCRDTAYSVAKLVRPTIC